MGLYENVQKAAEMRNKSINQIEKDLCLPRSSIAKYNAHIPSVDKIYRIALYLEVSTDFLISGKEDIVAREPAASGVPISRDAGRIIDKFYSLDETGQKKVEDYIDDLIASGKYKKVQALDA